MITEPHKTSAVAQSISLIMVEIVADKVADPPE